ncbi:DEAD/DEAH box helicase [Pectobacterium polaris]|uniref:DEAD/DEAH box helicase n=1 Tax=Pectobacterium polaris TaxID=2042057 RepID=UPI0019690708|nr:DEAD/DEAH box helicase family protein [Pectobacterium polaris]MBN3215550.1 DEAD/DEAH box helicase family protein [Pectobacterium polaris]
MKLNEIFKDPRSSIKKDDIDGPAYARTMRFLKRYKFWKGADEGVLGLWEHQQAAIATVVAYLSGNKNIPERPDQTEAVLLKLPTGTGKSGIVAVLSRCLPDVRRVLVLTPRTALTEQLMADISYRFWKHMGVKHGHSDTAIYTAKAQELGNVLDDVYVTQFLAKNVEVMAEKLSDPGLGRVIFVGTHQALGDIRRNALDSKVINQEQYANILETIHKSFDLIIVDEGHYEPAVSWSRGVREFNLPTLLLSATPYRNDYKSFRVRGRYLFNFSYQDAAATGIIRNVEIIPSHQMTDVAYTEQSVSAITQFVTGLQQKLKGHLLHAQHWFQDGAKPKVMVRGDDFETLLLLQTEVDRIFNTNSVVIHDRAKKTDENKNVFASVTVAQRTRADALVWIHQNKLMEGIDDSSFVAVGIYDLMENARQLVQQIGRITRYSKCDRKETQTGFIIASPANTERIRKTWNRYCEYEKYTAQNTSHMVMNEVTMPDRLLAYMANYQYISGEFRKRFEPDQPLDAEDIQLPLTATVLCTKEPLSDISALAEFIEEAIMEQDRFKSTPIKGLPTGSIGFTYYSWQNSPYLVDHFFSEWKLGIFLAVHQDNFVFMHDTEGLVVNIDTLGLKRAGRTEMEKAFPERDGNPPRLSHMSFSSLDMSQHAIRAMALRTRSFSAAFTDLLDPSLVPVTAAGFVNGKARYIGFNRSRLRDDSAGIVPVINYIKWTAEIAAELSDSNGKRNRVFDRYASLIENITLDKAKPVSVLLDPALEDMEAGVFCQNMDYFDLCAEVDQTTGTFTIQIGKESVPCHIAFIPETRRYRLTSKRLDELSSVQYGNNSRRQALTLVQKLNREQAFRVLTHCNDVVYTEGSFYQPKLNWVLHDELVTKPVLEYIHASPTLNDMMSEKGEEYYSKNKTDWYCKSIFGLFSAACNNQLNTSSITSDNLTEAIKAIPIWLCDDDTREIADFIGINPLDKKIIFVHAKIGNQEQSGTGFNVGGLQEVGRQALASLGFISRGEPSPVWAPERWLSPVQANKECLRGRNRIFRNGSMLNQPVQSDIVRNPFGLSAPELNKLLLAACRNPSFEREIWIVGAKIASVNKLDKGLEKTTWENRLRQFLMHWDTMQTACARANTRLRFFCSS